MDPNTTTKVQEILERIHHLVEQEQYSEVADLIDEHRLFLQKNADMKSQNQMNKTYALCMFHRVKDAYAVNKNAKDFVALFEKHRGLIEVHHKKSDYLNLLKIYNKIKKKRKNNIMGIILSVIVLSVAVFFLTGGMSFFAFHALNEPAQITQEKDTDSDQSQTEVANASTDSDVETTDSSQINMPAQNTESNEAEIGIPTQGTDPNESVSDMPVQSAGANEPVTNTPAPNTETNEAVPSTPIGTSEQSPSINPNPPATATTENTAKDNSQLLDSAGKILTLNDVKNMKADDIRMAINEMYARHGYYFGGYNQKYFESKSWYKVDPTLTNPSDATKNFSQIEHANLSFLVNREKRLKGH